jgi:hypothetical protein
VGRQEAILQPRQIVVAVSWAISRARKTSNQKTPIMSSRQGLSLLAGYGFLASLPDLAALHQDQNDAGKIGREIQRLRAAIKAFRG